MALDLGDDLTAGYEQLRKERGWSYETLADHVGTTDPRLAAYFRERAQGNPDTVPSGRSAESTQTAEQTPAAGVGGTIEAERREGEELAGELGVPGQPAGEADTGITTEEVKAEAEAAEKRAQGSPEGTVDHETGKDVDGDKSDEKSAAQKSAAKSRSRR